MIGWYIIAVVFVLVCLSCFLRMATRPPSPCKFKCTTCGEWVDRKKIAYMAGNENYCMEMLCFPCAEKAGKVLPKEFWDKLRNLRKQEDKLDHQENVKPDDPRPRSKQSWTPR